MGRGRAEAEVLDAADLLAGFRNRFEITDTDLVYLDGNSLGRLPVATRARMARALDEWGTDLVRGWEHWIDLPLEVGDRIGRAVLGAAPGQVMVCDSTTVNLHKLAGAAMAAARPGAVVVRHEGDFPTDRYVVDALAAAAGLQVRTVATTDTAELGAAIHPDVALVVLSHVDYRTGAAADVAAVTELAHASGALTLWDLSHGAGAVEVHLDDWGVDLATGCTYKYLNGGPGSPAWLYVRRSLQDRLVPPVHGWFGAADQFAMGPSYTPAPGIRRWLSGTPNVMGLVAVDEAVALIAEAGMGSVAAKLAALMAYATELAHEVLAPAGFACRTPLEGGTHLALAHPEAYRISRALVADHAVVPDFREPDILRVGLSPLTTRFVEVWDGIDRIRRCTEGEGWRAYDTTRGRIT